MRKIRSYKQLVGRLRQQRLEKGWSQRELAEETGLTQQAIARIEKGEVSPTLLTLFKVIAALDLELTLDQRR
ncbi:MAG: helix-turn-helix transcriptional regulator [Bdellovibrionaceae bacterium]|jgi:transcriptional regulator with XRE-family HTH domain|nr:helix-turn-helix transcriptional regulator [Pseudobdellovibrionaceae bacterium]